MSTALIALVWFALWSVLLVMNVARIRVVAVMSGKAPPSGFPSGVQHGTDAEWRANRAQNNAAENLPIFAALVLSGVAAGATEGLFSALAVIVVVARIAQSLLHMSSGRSRVVNLRFAAFVVQIACFLIMGGLLLTHFYSG